VIGEGRLPARDPDGITKITRITKLTKAIFRKKTPLLSGLGRLC
jgi:hypothetical protein